MSDEQRIMEGQPASEYAEAVLVDMAPGGGRCSGALLAPEIVLTAGHCVYGSTEWTVRAPFADGQTVTTGEATAFDWTAMKGDQLNAGEHDIALLFLPKPIVIPHYPLLQKTELPNPRAVVNVGRVLNGEVSDHTLYVSQAVVAAPANGVGFPYDYVSTQSIQKGDSGGPSILAGSSPHLIVGVNSGTMTNGRQLLARVDQMYDWITRAISEEAAADPKCVGLPEGESSGTFLKGQHYEGPICGRISPVKDQDFFTWKPPQPDVDYRMTIAASNDALLYVWLPVDEGRGGYEQVPATSATEVNLRAKEGETYVISLGSRAGRVQNYRLAIEPKVAAAGN